MCAPPVVDAILTEFQFTAKSCTRNSDEYNTLLILPQTNLIHITINISININIKLVLILLLLLKSSHLKAKLEFLTTKIHALIVFQLWRIMVPASPNYLSDLHVFLYSGSARLCGVSVLY